MPLYENSHCTESQSRHAARTRYLPEALRTALPPLAQPGKRGALPHGSAHGPGAEELRHHRRSGGGHLDRTLTTFVDRCDLGAPGPRSATRDGLGGAESTAWPPAAG